MAESSGIAWTDHTFNPWIGCTKVGPLCDNCYAEEWDRNRGGGGHWGPHAERRRTKTWRDPVKWQKDAEEQGKSFKVFTASLADFFDNQVPKEWRRDAWQLVKDCPSLDWLLVTKRLGNVPDMLPEDWSPETYRHVTLIASMGTQQEIDRDGPKLKKVKADHGFARVGISAEPLLEEVSLFNLLFEPECCEKPRVIWGRNGPSGEECCGSPNPVPTGWLDWVICGGESGGKRRPFNVEWAESLREECGHGGAAFFFKQDGAFRPGQRGAASEDLWSCKQFPAFRGVA